MPKYVRVNTLKTDTGNVLKHFVGLGFRLLDQNEPVDLEQQQQQQKWIKLDDTIPHLIAIGPPSSIQFHTQPLFLDASIIIQDKASCMPVYALKHTLESLGIATDEDFHFVDACAAPGNKTTYLASLYPKCKLIAFDKDQRRATDLMERVRDANATNVEVQCTDFLTTKPSKFRNVRAIIVDPSCSGSGIITREVNQFDLNAESIAGDARQMKRIEKLAAFQQSIVEHAMTFKNAQVVIYSTCSTYWQENENVVSRVLETFGDRFALYKALPQWPTRGVAHVKKLDGQIDFSHVADSVIRTNFEQHHTNGFFVACFVRKDLLQRGAEIMEEEDEEEIKETEKKEKRKRADKDKDETKQKAKRRKK